MAESGNNIIITDICSISEQEFKQLVANPPLCGCTFGPIETVEGVPGMHITLCRGHWEGVMAILFN